MAKLNNYDGTIELISGITQKNGGDFALIDAHAVQTDEQGTRLDEALTNLKVQGGSSYEIGEGLLLDEETNTLSVDVTSNVEQDNTKPITSAAVYTQIGNINVLLETI